MKKLGSYLFLAFIIMSNERYTRNRNMWKKTYPTVRHKPRIIELVSVTGVTASINLETYQRHRSYYSLYSDSGYLTSSGTTGPLYLIWEDGKVITDGIANQTYTITFDGQFQEPPIVCFKIFTSGSNVLSSAIDINYSSTTGWAKPIPLIYGIGTPTTESAQFKLSYPYSGSVHYFATAPTSSFPINFTGSVYFTGSNEQASAGISQSNGITSQSLIWDGLSAPSSSQIIVLQTPFFVSGSEYEATRAVALSTNGLQTNYEKADTGTGGSLSGSTAIISSSGSFYHHYIAYRFVT